MNTVIFRTIAPTLTSIMLVFSVFVLLRGHNEPGGGFIGGLIAASAVAIYGIAAGVDEVRQALRKTLFKYKLHQDKELFEKAYEYIREYY